MWKCEENGFQLEIITDEDVKKIIRIVKSSNLVEEEEVIKQKFLDVIFEYKITKLITEESI